MDSQPDIASASIDHANGPQQPQNLAQENNVARVHDHTFDTPTADFSESRLSSHALDILARIADAFIVLDRDWHLVYANARACEINQKPLSAFLGRTLWEEWPALVGTEAEHQYRRALAEGIEVHFEHHYADDPYDVWLEIDAYPTDEGLSLFYRDITARKRAEQALQRSQEDLRLAVDAAQIGTFYCDYPLDKIVWNDTCKAHFFLAPDAEVDFDLFYSLLHPDDRDPTRHAIERALAEGVGYDVEYRTLAPDGRTRWVNAVGHFYYDLSGAPIRFDGITLDISERKAAEEALLRHAEREALLNRIGQSLRASLDPETVQTAAINLLGEALGADRCYFATYNLVQGVVTIDRDWHRPNLPSVQGVYPFVNTAEMFAELYQGTNASAIEDAHTAALSTQTKANMQALGLRSRVSVALVENDGIMATLTAAMADSPRRWTEAEASLVEAVATQLRTAVETARVTQREHRIAQQLQSALQPPTPASVPGLTLADYYRPAWEDQGVGGDFSDIFSDDKGTTFLVVGDLSGKGLAAASQVAMVRNMLRFSLYNGRSVAGPVTALNRTLADHDLLTGFTTLFVGRYDAGTRVLSYVNCGQDAGLVLRAASRDVDPLPPTGPVLGAISSASYTEDTITLEAGDVLALYSDGLTEAGPSRTTLLTGDGVAALLKQQAGIADARIIVERLIAGVDAYAGAGVRDDQCLLVAVVDPFVHS